MGKQKKKTFFSLKTNKNLDYGDISVNSISSAFDSIFEPLRYIFDNLYIW